MFQLIALQLMHGLKSYQGDSSMSRYEQMLEEFGELYSGEEPDYPEPIHTMSKED